jgi:RNA polymerase sigma factor (sigma-70 family)
MIPPNASFVDLLQLVREGDQRAAEQLMKVYGPSVIRAVRRSLHHRMRPYFDSMDFVQDVWASVFATAPEKWTFQSTGQFIRLLTTIARNKIIDAARSRLGRRKDDVREIRLEDVSESRLRQTGETLSQHLREQEEWIAFLQGQPPVYRRIFLMFRDGIAPAQIAANLNISHRTVNRVLRKIIVGGSS